jgi:Acyl-CoA dehydrogenase, C-terminal domain
MKGLPASEADKSPTRVPGRRLPVEFEFDADQLLLRQTVVPGAELAATTVGACRRILDLVVAHVKQREQFGVPIGSFQAVKHKAADMYVAIERARVLAYYCALTIAEDDPRRHRAALMAKAAAGECQQVGGGRVMRLGAQAEVEKFRHDVVNITLSNHISRTKSH